MKLSARNVLKGKVTGVIKGVTTYNVKLDIGHGIIITSSITAEAVKELKIKKGDNAYAIIKASEVIVGKDD
jgi:molybdopterin-binding protein